MKTIQKTFKGLLMLSLIIAFLTGCEKYDEGGLISMSEKRLTAHVWKLDKYFRNGVDETSQVLISDFTETFSDNGNISRSYIDEDGDLYSNTGDWEFDNNKFQIKLSGVSSIKLTNQAGTVSSSDYNIIKLKKKELWYSYDNGGDSHEFHFVPN